MIRKELKKNGDVQEGTIFKGLSDKSNMVSFTYLTVAQIRQFMREILELAKQDCLERKNFY